MQKIEWQAMKAEPHVVIFVEGGQVQRIVCDQTLHYTILHQDAVDVAVGGILGLGDEEGAINFQPFPGGQHPDRPFVAVLTDLTQAPNPAEVKHYADQIPPE